LAAKERACRKFAAAIDPPISGVFGRDAAP
jgi:hypothetical protein